MVARALRVVAAGFVLAVAPLARSDGNIEVLHAFVGDDGGHLQTPLTQAPDGLLYGTTSNATGPAKLFTIAPDGTYTVLHTFAAGLNPQGALVRDTDGSFYGAASGWDVPSEIFRLTPAGAVETFYAFTGEADGQWPTGLVKAADGHWYGTAYQGGIWGIGGSLFRLTSDGILTTLHMFDPSTEGFGPRALVEGPDGLLYGALFAGGPTSLGSVFRASLNGDVTVLHSFPDATSQNPISALTLASDGNFYGAFQGLNSCKGGIYRMTPAGQVTVLRVLGQPGYCEIPRELIQADDGHLYGVTNAGRDTVFQLSLQGDLRYVHVFTGADGIGPSAGLVQALDGHLYGTTHNGGSEDNKGTVFRVNLPLLPPPPLPSVSVVTHELDVAEGQAGYVTFALSEATDRDVVIHIAGQGGDFEAFDFELDRVVTVPAGQLTASARFYATPGDGDEDQETGRFGILSVENAQQTVDSVFQVTIQDLDPVPTISFFGEPAAFTREGSGDEIWLVAKLSAMSGREVRLNLALSGSADRGTDYAIATQSLVIAPGSDHALTKVRILNNGVIELDEDAIFTLEPLINVEPGEKMSHTIRIQDNDPEALFIRNFIQNVGGP